MSSRSLKSSGGGTVFCVAEKLRKFSSSSLGCLAQRCPRYRYPCCSSGLQSFQSACTENRKNKRKTIGIDWENVAGFVSFAYWAFSIPINDLPRG